MKKRIPIWQWPAIAPLALVLAANAVQAQPPNPNETSYPYWATAPQSFGPSRITLPVPSPSPSAISNASRGPAPATNTGVGIGGGFIPPFLMARDTTLPQRPTADGSNKAHIWVRVPENAEIWVNGVKTKQTGESRYFFSPPLTAGKKYSYQMRLRWTKDGKPVEETQRILVQAGQTIRRDFTTK